jgi:hypothetical protein
MITLGMGMHDHGQRRIQIELTTRTLFPPYAYLLPGFQYRATEEGPNELRPPNQFHLFFFSCGHNFAVPSIRGVE